MSEKHIEKSKKLLFGITRSNVSAQDIVKHGEEINATSG
jgi:hypothetical protein